MHKIGVLDSGKGGLTTCCYIFRHIPQINIIYYADNKNAPYGSKTEAEVYAAVREGAAYLVNRGCSVIVLACNTATAAAVSGLRAEFDVEIVGTEPAVKQAKSAGGKTLYLATPLTIEKRGNSGMEIADTSLLATWIEGIFRAENALRKLSKKVVSDGHDNVVLGCTHYSFLKKYIAESYPDIRVFDGGEGVARQVKRKLNIQNSRRGGHLFLHFSGEEKIAEYLLAFRRFSKGEI